MSRAASRVARSMREAMQRAGDEASGVPVFGTVLDISPWAIELHGAATVLDEDDLTISRWVEQYHHWVGVEVDDTAVLVEMEDGDYVVVDVVTDADPFDLPGTTGFVPYTGATNDLDLGSSHKLLFNDVNLYRSASNVLKTDDHLVIGPPAAATAGLSMAYQGSTHAVIFNRTAGNPSNGNVLLVTAQDLGTDANPQDTTVGISGYETGKGTVKVTHHKPVAAVTGSDDNASALSLRCNGAGTAAQGIFFDAEDTGGTTGKLLNFRQEGVEKFVVAADGAITSQGKLTLPLAGSGGGLLVGGDCNLYRTAADNWRTDDLFMVVRASAGTPALSATISGSSPANFVINADGKHEWGSGAATRDVVLYRGAADVLRTDDSLAVTAIAAAALQTEQTASNVAFQQKLLAADANAAFRILGDGRLQWGAGGASAVDVTLSRFNSTSLQLTSGLSISGNLNLSASGQINALAQSSFNTSVLQTKPTGAANVQFSIDAVGFLTWGPGSTTIDTALKREGVAILAARNAADSAYGILRAASPSGTDDVATKGYVDAQHAVPNCIAYRSSDTSDLTTGTWTAIALNAEDVDENTPSTNMHDNSTNSERIVCRVAGLYLVTANIAFVANATGDRGLRIWKNAASLMLAQSDTGNAGGSDFAQLNASAVVRLAVNDYVYMEGFQASGGGLAVKARSGIADTHLSLTLLGL